MEKCELNDGFGIDCHRCGSSELRSLCHLLEPRIWVVALWRSVDWRQGRTDYRPGPHPRGYLGRERF